MSQNTDAAAGKISFRSIFWAIIFACMMVPLLIFVISLLGRYFYLCELIGNFRAYILGMLVPCGLILWSVGKRKRALMYGAATLWSCIGVLTPILPSFSQPPPGNEIVKIMSFNVLGENHEIDHVVERIHQHDPDVVTILEYANHWPPGLEKLNDDYPYRLTEPRWHGFGIAIFSKRPIKSPNVTLITRDVTDNPLSTVVIEVDGQPIRLAGLHLLSPMNRRRLKIRNRQLEEIADVLNREDLPTIVMGDFNCTPWSPFLRDFLKATDLRDSRQGFGYQASWNADKSFLMIPIDHAFVSPEIHVHSRQLGEFAGSDHYPLIFEISLSPKE